MSDAFTTLQVFALIGLFMLVGALVLGEMFDRAIQRDLEERDAFDAARERKKEDRR